jgi:hypothetical protein
MELMCFPCSCCDAETRLSCRDFRSGEGRPPMANDELSHVTLKELTTICFEEIYSTHIWCFLGEKLGH